MKKRIIIALFLVLLSTLLFQFCWKSTDDDFVFYAVNPKQHEVNFYLKDGKGVNFGSIANLKAWLNQRKTELVFATNGGMYKTNKSPLGLYIQDEILISPIDRNSGDGNFYLKPNGIFYLTKNDKAFICKTEDFQVSKKIKYATQSGPMLVIDGETHKAFNKNSTNLNIRNGVGILPNNEILFAMSKKGINFYEFAEFFKSKGCKNALYLDGFVSRTYCPKQNWIQTDGDFGVIIGVVSKN
jgi:uncharacterized protein YigE (DUF2233 family)